MNILQKSFYSRDAASVASDLLGKILVVKTTEGKCSGMIVETEAYYGNKDPASRAYHGKKNMNLPMWEEPGKVFAYMVHAHWMFNIVTGKKDEPSAVLVRAIEPTDGIELMKKRRNYTDSNIRNLCRGPGRMSRAMGIFKEHNLHDVTKSDGEIIITEPENKGTFKIGKSNRIGVTKDLKRKLRFFIKDNKFVS